MLNLLRAPSRLLRRMYDWTIAWSRTRHAPRALFAISFVEASFFPIPPDALLMPMVLADRARWWRAALVCTAGSVTGAALGYVIGWALYETVGRAIVEFYHLQEGWETVEVLYQQNAFLAVVGAAFSPIPFKVFTIAGGAFDIGLGVLLAAATVGRAGRFFLVAGLLRLFGARIAVLIEKYFDVLALLFVVLLIGGFVALRFLK